MKQNTNETKIMQIIIPNAALIWLMFIYGDTFNIQF